MARNTAPTAVDAPSTIESPVETRFGELDEESLTPDRAKELKRFFERFDAVGSVRVDFPIKHDDVNRWGEREIKPDRENPLGVAINVKDQGVAAVNRAYQIAGASDLDIKVRDEGPFVGVALTLR